HPRPGRRPRRARGLPGRRLYPRRGDHRRRYGCRRGIQRGWERRRGRRALCGGPPGPGHPRLCRTTGALTMPKYMIERQYLLPIYHHLAIEAATFAAACAAAMDETKHGWKGAQPDPENARAHTLTRAVEVPAEWADKTAAPAWYLYDAALPALPIPRAHREAPEAPLLDRRHLGTVLAALRYWQRSGEFAGDEIAEIATDGDTLTPLSNTEIDALCEALNT